ncbi:MAG: serine hydrolase [Clostridia bacterium]|nr:serine hydrolase [Clostridia bacterium]
MLNSITPEKAGISSRSVKRFVEALEKRNLPMHQLILMRGYDIFGEFYWKPFDRDFCHRMYSQTKSYVSVAIGLLVEDGKLSLEDKLCDIFFEKLDGAPRGYLAELTIENMLKMETCGCYGVPFWFYDDDPDRTHMYLNRNEATVPPDMRWSYDSAGSQVLSSIVEKLTGKTLFDFLNERIFTHLDAFHTAEILKTKNGDTWGDSALVCTPRDMAAFARFVMNKGMWHGKRLMSSDYLERATSRLADNNIGIVTAGFDTSFSYGYGYQIWRVRDGFAFNGMGSQFTVCLPDYDLIFVCTADTQGLSSAEDLIISALYDHIVENLENEPLCEDIDSYNSLLAYGDTLKLYAMTGDTESPYSSELDGRVWKCDTNPLGWTQFAITFEKDNAVLHWTNAQGNKVLPFGLCYNTFEKFPQLGYQNDHGGVVTSDGFMYNGAFSAAWREEKKILFKGQIIDRYFGNFTAEFSFKGERAYVRFVKVAEGFLEEYNGAIIAHASNECI